MSVISSSTGIGLSILGKALSYLRNKRANDSLISFTQPARVEPLLLVDQRVMDHNKAIEVATSMQNLFTAFYLQAVNLGGDNVLSVKMMKTLDRFNPNRDSVNALANSRWLTSMESFEDALPIPVDEAALENYENGIGSRLAAERYRVAMEASPTVDAAKELKEQGNLSVGRIVNVTLKEGENSLTVPVMIRLSAQFVEPSRLVHILTTNALDDMAARDRAYTWKDSAKLFITDTILANDAIERERSRLMKDTDGLYSTIVSRKNKGFAAAALSGRASIGAASALAILSRDTADEIEVELGFGLDHYKTRQLIFSNTSLMIIAVLDAAWNKVEFYYRGIDTSNTVDLAALSAANKSGGADTMEILKAFQLGNAPRM